MAGKRVKGQWLVLVVGNTLVLAMAFNLAAGKKNICCGENSYFLIVK